MYNMDISKKELVSAYNANKITIDDYGLENYQKLNRNYNNPNTYVPRHIIFHRTGAGKTCTAVQIAEQFINYRNINHISDLLVYVIGNKISHDNFISEVTNECGNIANDKDPYADNKYISNEDKAILIKLSLDKSEKGIKEFRSFRKKKLYVRLSQAGYRFFSYQKIINSTVSNFNNSVVIIDEAHNLLNKNKYYDFVKSILEVSINTRIILLSATPMYNEPDDIVEFINILFKKDQELKHSDIFSSKSVLRPDGIKKIKEKLKGIVSYVGLTEKSADFPVRVDIGKALPSVELDGISYKPTTKLIRVQMSALQLKEYTALYNGLMTHDIRFITNLVFPEGIYRDLEVSIASASNDYKKKYGINYNKRFTGTALKVQNLVKYSPKYAKCISDLIDECYDGQNFIYNTFVHGSGIRLIGDVLRENGFTEYEHDTPEKYRSYKTFKYTTTDIPAKYVLLHQDITPDKRKEIENTFNSKENIDGKLIKIIIGSQLTKESINLKRIRYVHILNYQENFSRMNQIIGRAIRYGSHADVADKHVYIRRYVSSIGLHSPQETKSTPKSAESQKSLSAEELEYVKDEKNYEIIKKIENAISSISIESMLSASTKDTSTYFFYRDHEVFDIKILIKKFFTVDVIIDKESLYEYLFNYDNDIVTYAINTMIKNVEPVTNENGIKGKIVKIGSNYLFQPFELDNPYIDYNSRKYGNGTIMQSKDITNIVIEYNEEKGKSPDIAGILKTLDSTVDTDQFILELSTLSFNIRIALVEKSIIEYLHTKKKIEPVYYRILRYFKNYLIDENMLSTDLNNSNHDDYFTSLTFSEIDPKKKFIGHFVDSIPRIYNGKAFEQSPDFFNKKKSKTLKNNDFIIGYMDKTKSGDIVFKLKYTQQDSIHDRRMISRGFVCDQINDKSVIYKIMDKLGIERTAKEEKIETYCEMIHKDLINKQLADKKGIRWFSDYKI
jgi:hypothetical protein